MNASDSFSMAFIAAKPPNQMAHTSINKAK